MGKFTCPICGMEFKAQREHEVHHVGVHASPKGDIACIACGYSSRDQKKMEEHEKIHFHAGM